MICEVVDFTEEGLATPEGEEGEKGILKINWSINWFIECLSLVQKAKVLTPRLSGHWYYMD
jgi:hypothetical protein